MSSARGSPDSSLVVVRDKADAPIWSDCCNSARSLFEAAAATSMSYAPAKTFRAKSSASAGGWLCISSSSRLKHWAIVCRLPLHCSYAFAIASTSACSGSAGASLVVVRRSIVCCLIRSSRKLSRISSCTADTLSTTYSPRNSFVAKSRASCGASLFNLRKSRPWRLAKRSKSPSASNHRSSHVRRSWSVGSPVYVRVVVRRNTDWARVKSRWSCSRHAAFADSSLSAVYSPFSNLLAKSAASQGGSSSNRVASKPHSVAIRCASPPNLRNSDVPKARSSSDGPVPTLVMVRLSWLALLVSCCTSPSSDADGAPPIVLLRARSMLGARRGTSRWRLALLEKSCTGALVTIAGSTAFWQELPVGASYAPPKTLRAKSCAPAGGFISNCRADNPN
mmetsp:Transcript_50859/g.154699  ORF Transcript_50859/g.154699 Transcript_50859/m.154699 type:complete len:393 (-) Transcript_50859:1048-2226(-)